MKGPGAAGMTVLVAVLVPACGFAQPEERMVAGAKLYEVLPRDAIRALDELDLVTVADAKRFMDPEEPVLGVEMAGEARCYSTWLLEGHEIVNDSLGGRPIAVSW